MGDKMDFLGDLGTSAARSEIGRSQGAICKEWLPSIRL
jgi:hypothetical protein